VPLGRSDADMGGDFPTGRGTTEPTHEASDTLPSAAALVLMKLRRDQPVGGLIIAVPPDRVVRSNPRRWRCFMGEKMRRVVQEKQPLSIGLAN